MKTKKFNKKRYNRNIKTIYPYNNKGFFQTRNEYLARKRYENLTNQNLVKEIFKLDKQYQQIPLTDSSKRNVGMKIQKLAKQQLEYLIDNKSKIKGFFNSLSFDKVNKNYSYFTAFTNLIYYPYSIAGNKYLKKFDEFYDWVSEFPSIYNYKRSVAEKNFQSIVRLMKEDECKNLLENGKNLNPSWSSKSNVWERFGLAPLFDGKTNFLVGANVLFDDVIFNSTFAEFINQKDGFVKGNKSEAEIFVRKNANVYDPMPILSKSFEDIQKKYPFIPNDFRLNSTEALNGFLSSQVLYKSFDREVIEEYGYIFEDDRGYISYQPKNPTEDYKQIVRELECWLVYFETQKKMIEFKLSKTAPFTKYYKSGLNSLAEINGNIKSSKRILDNRKECLKLAEKGKYKTLWVEAFDKKSIVPIIQFDNGVNYLADVIGEWRDKKNGGELKFVDNPTLKCVA